MRVVSLVSGVEIWAMDIIESSLVDFDGDRLTVRCEAPGNCSKSPGAYSLHAVPTGEHLPIKWVADDQPFGGSGVSVRLIAPQHS